MTTPTDTEMIRDVAEGLGWDCTGGYAVCMDDTPPEWDLEPTTTQVDLLAFAAYTMTAMAGRGWRLWMNYGTVSGEKLWLSSRDRRRKTEPVPYDPTDPASWAMAVIRCAWEALKGGNDGTQS